MTDEVDLTVELESRLLGCFMIAVVGVLGFTVARLARRLIWLL